ncbi:13043_t:CDS:2, partial [Dentiscutata heterogama]
NTIMLIFAEEKNNKLVPLQKVIINACVVDMIAEVNIVQVYQNLEEDKIEAIYKFMVNDTAAVCGFEATIDERKFIGIQGYWASLLEEQDSDVLKCSVGNIMPRQKVEIKIKYVIELQNDAESDSVRLILPATIAPKYGSYYFNRKRDTKISDSSDYSPIEFFITCRMSSSINSIKSPSHPDHIFIDDKDNEQGISKVTSNKDLYYLENDFILLIKSQDIGKP